jgi:hypothetical protein
MEVSGSHQQLYLWLGIHAIVGWVGPRTDLDAVDKNKLFPLQGIENDSPSTLPEAYR